MLYLLTKLRSSIFFMVLFLATLSSAFAVEVDPEIMVDWVVNESGHDVDVSLAEKIVMSVLTQASLKNIDPFVLLSIIKIESGFKVNATSKMGAKGLMQVIPKWHLDKIAGRRLNDVHVNIEVGSTILGDCVKSNNGSFKRALRCYSSGATAYMNKLNRAYDSIRGHYASYE